MSDFKHKAMSGSLFRNKEKKSDKSPDYTGTCNVRGEILRVAGWLKGEPKYLSLAFSEPQQKQDRPPKPAEPHADFPDEIPF